MSLTYSNKVILRRCLENLRNQTTDTKTSTCMSYYRRFLRNKYFILCVQNPIKREMEHMWNLELGLATVSNHKFICSIYSVWETNAMLMSQLLLLLWAADWCLVTSRGAIQMFTAFTVSETNTDFAFFLIYYKGFVTNTCDYLQFVYS